MSAKNTLFLCSPPETFVPHKDTTRVLMEEALRRGYGVYTCTHLDLEIFDGQPQARVRKMDLHDDPWYRCGEPERLQLNELHSIWFRHDPPFDETYLHATQIVDMAAQPLKVNAPAGLRGANEKLSATTFSDLLPTTLVSRDPERILAFLLENNNRCVVKPIDGFGGEGIFVLQADDPNLGVILQTATRTGWTMVQAFIDAAYTGDMRVLLMDGEVIGQFLRVPKQGEFRGNMMQGGSVQQADLTPAAMRIVERVRPYLAESGLRLVGLDVVGEYLTEINVTSPTGFQEVRKLTGIAPEVAVWDAVERDGSS